LRLMGLISGSLGSHQLYISTPNLCFTHVSVAK
jgi:hypothetical protein